MKLLLYCTKSKAYLNDCKLTNPNKRYHISNKGRWSIDLSTQQTYSSLNGKIAGECDFEVEEITSKNLISFEKESCIDRVSMLKYLKPNLIWDNSFATLLNTFGDIILGYATHIKNLHIFDKPKELSDYYASDEILVDEDNIRKFKSIKKAPQNMMYAYEYYEKWGYRFFEKKVLISIRPEGLCKILNKEKNNRNKKKNIKGDD